MAFVDDVVGVGDVVVVDVGVLIVVLVDVGVDVDVDVGVDVVTETVVDGEVDSGEVFVAVEGVDVVAEVGVLSGFGVDEGSIVLTDGSGVAKDTGVVGVVDVEGDDSLQPVIIPNIVTRIRIPE